MARHWKIAIAVLGALVVVGGLTLPALLRSVLRLHHPTMSEEQERREVTQPPISTPSDIREKAQLFWVSPTAPTMLEAVPVEMALSADPVHRAKQLIDALITQAPSPAQRTLPADTELIEFYLLPDGTGVADFSEALSSQTPSGIMSEQMAVDSIVRTLGANMSAVKRLKILIRGQQVDTLAGHLDLTGFFPVEPSGASTPSSAETTAPAPPTSPVAAPSAAAKPIGPAPTGAAAGRH
jgi:Sporulation and spore germination